jgi:hypothetical protein
MLVFSFPAIYLRLKQFAISGDNVVLCHFRHQNKNGNNHRDFHCFEHKKWYEKNGK